MYQDNYILKFLQFAYFVSWFALTKLRTVTSCVHCAMRVGTCAVLSEDTKTETTKLNVAGFRKILSRKFKCIQYVCTSWRSAGN